jgi:hypothetical protein
VIQTEKAGHPARTVNTLKGSFKDQGSVLDAPNLHIFLKNIKYSSRDNSQAYYPGIGF